MIIKNKIICVTIGIVFASLIIINSNLIFTTGPSDKSTEYSDEIILDNENVRLSKISGPIYINDDNPSNNWSVAKDAGICTGSGTSSDPYVIEDLVIDGGSDSCIVIENSNVYFMIKNCTLYDSGSIRDMFGILLSNTKNGQLINNNCSFNQIGISLDSDCKDNTVSGNIVNSNIEYGIDLYGSSNNIIKENTVNFNGNMGINLSPNSSYNEIVNNTVSFNGWLGIHLNDDSTNNLIVSNNCSHNIDGISVRTLNNTISENYIEYNSGSGIHLWGGDTGNNTLSNNITRNFISNNNDGITFKDESSYNIIEGNRIFNNSGTGFWIHAGCHDNLIFNNTFIDNIYANAYDDGTSNQWDNGTIGNYWSDYPGVDANDDGIGDTPYDIPGTASSQDNFPIWDDGPEFKIPGYNLYVLLGILPIVAIVLSKKIKK
jgi:parallel beta-helix repeat protein